MSTLTATSARPSLRQKIGYVLAALFGLGNVPSVLGAPADGEAGPPMFILWIDTVLGVLVLVAAVVAWRKGAVWARIAAVGMVLITLTALPGLFVSGIPTGIRIAVGGSIVITLLVIWMMLAPTDRRGELR